MNKPIVLVIADGLGVAEKSKGNAVSLAKKEFLNKLWNEYPTIKIKPSSLSVGLPEGQMGNSEVGHLTIGAGRVINQPLVQISESIKTKDIMDKEVIKKVVEHSKANNSTIHLIGLISDGGVHSHIDHIIGLNNLLIEEGNDVIIHAIMDGRDTEPALALKFITKLKENDIRIGSISGRYYAMDRDSNFDRTKKAYDAIVNRKGNSYDCSKDYVTEQLNEGITDEFIIPAWNSKFEANIKSNDAIIFMNFRPDRARQLSHLFVNSNVYEEKVDLLENIYIASIMEYASIPTNIIFEPTTHKNLLGEVLEKNKIKQLRAAETEKFAHVTFFMDGGKEIDFEGEEKLLIPSPKVETYDLKPEMSAEELTNKVLEKMDNYDVVIMNYANPDMVGHTGNIEATINAIETVSKQSERIFNKVMELNGVFIFTADHGNAEMMLDENNNSWPAHTTNDVLFTLTKGQYTDFALENNGTLANIAPTILKLLEIEIPEDMTSEPLIK